MAPIVGHVGDGNFHVLPLIGFTNPAEVERGDAFVERLVKRALAHDGTSTGEHGIGQSNRRHTRPWNSTGPRSSHECAPSSAPSTRTTS